MNPRQRNILLLGILGLVALVVLFYFLLLGPLLQTLDEQAQAREAREAQLADIERQIAELEEVRRNSPELQRQLLELGKRLPEQPEVETFIVQVEEVAEAAGVTQTEVVRADPGPPAGGGDFTVQPVTMTFEGTYEELLAFLTGIDDLVRLTAINDVTYEVVEEEGTTAAPEIEQNLSVQVEAEIYFQSAGVPDGAAPVAPGAPETTAGPEVTGG